MGYFEKIKLACSNDQFIFHFRSDTWGSEVLIMEKTGIAFVRVYWYNDDSTSIYINWLSVDTDFRNKRVGTKLLELCEEIGIAIGVSNAYLWVDHNSWMHDWYKRCDYIDYKKHDDENFIWMRKTLKKNTYEVVTDVCTISREIQSEYNVLMRRLRDGSADPDIFLC
jgi:N-acetylglutamate synthase-like GNAT family acetyltransferase